MQKWANRKMGQWGKGLVEDVTTTIVLSTEVQCTQCHGSAIEINSEALLSNSVSDGAREVIASLDIAAKELAGVHGEKLERRERAVFVGTLLEHTMQMWGNYERKWLQTSKTQLGLNVINAVTKGGAKPVVHTVEKPAIDFTNEKTLVNPKTAEEHSTNPYKSEKLTVNPKTVEKPHRSLETEKPTLYMHLKLIYTL